MSWNNDGRDRTRERWRTANKVPRATGVPLLLKQAVACAFIFALVFGASKADKGMALDVAAFARDSTSSDLSFEEVRAWANGVPDRVSKLTSWDIGNFWSKAVTGKPTELAWPVTGTVTSFFGWRSNPTGEGMELHQGIDIDAAKGIRVVAALAGTVSDVRTSPEFGLVVEVKHAGDFSTVYGHLDSASVQKDQKVAKGDPIGTVGDNGNATAPHLHFELRKGGVEVDPMTMLPPLKQGT